MNILEQNENVISDQESKKNRSEKSVMKLSKKDRKKMDKRKKKEDKKKRKQEKKRLKQQNKKNKDDLKHNRREKEKEKNDTHRHEIFNKEENKDKESQIQNIPGTEKDKMKNFSLEASNNNVEKWNKLEHQWKNNNVSSSSSLPMYRTTSLSIYEHVPWYNFEPTMNSPEDFTTTSSPPKLTKSKSESNLPQKFMKPKAKKDNRHVSDQSKSPSPRLSQLHPWITSNNDFINHHHHLLYESDPEQLKNQIYATLKERENKYCFDLSSHQDNSIYQGFEGTNESFYFNDDDVDDSEDSISEYENFLNYENYLKSCYYYDNDDHDQRQFHFYNKQQESDDGSHWYHPTKKVYSNSLDNKNIFFNLISSSSSSSSSSLNTSSPYTSSSIYDMNYNHLRSMKVHPNENYNTFYDHPIPHDSWPPSSSSISQEKMYNDDNFEEEYNKSLSKQSKSTDSKNSSDSSPSTSTSTSNSINSSNHSANKSQSDTKNHTIENRNFKRNSHSSSNFTQTDDSYDMCLCSKHGSCSCPSDCYCKNTTLLSYSSNEEKSTDLNKK